MKYRGKFVENDAGFVGIIAPSRALLPESVKPKSTALR